MTFTVATLAWGDDNARDDFDDRSAEDRWRRTAYVRALGGFLLVVWTERLPDTVRIISARYATPAEIHRYRDPSL